MKFSNLAMSEMFDGTKQLSEQACDHGPMHHNYHRPIYHLLGLTLHDIAASQYE